MTGLRVESVLAELTTFIPAAVRDALRAARLLASAAVA
jgi:hypothetical protein